MSFVMLLVHDCSVCGNKHPKEISDSLFSSLSRTRLCFGSHIEVCYFARKFNPKTRISVSTDFEDNIVVEAIASGALSPDISDVAATE